MPSSSQFLLTGEGMSSVPAHLSNNFSLQHLSSSAGNPPVPLATKSHSLGCMAEWKDGPPPKFPSSTPQFPSSAPKFPKFPSCAPKFPKFSSSSTALSIPHHTTHKEKRDFIKTFFFLVRQSPHGNGRKSRMGKGLYTPQPSLNTIIPIMKSAANLGRKAGFVPLILHNSNGKWCVKIITFC